MMNRKGQIELSANFIIIIVLSTIVLVGGLTLFYKMIHAAQNKVITLDDQTEAKIRDMMLDSDRVAVYPRDISITSGDSEKIGIGITNIFEEESTFYINLNGVKLYNDANPDGIQAPGNLIDYSAKTADSVTIAPHEKEAKGMLLIMPKGSPQGQYTYTIKITNGTSNDYGLVQVIVHN